MLRLKQSLRAYMHNFRFSFAACLALSICLHLLLLVIHKLQKQAPQLVRLDLTHLPSLQSLTIDFEIDPAHSTSVQPGFNGSVEKISLESQPESGLQKTAMRAAERGMVLKKVQPIVRNFEKPKKQIKAPLIKKRVQPKSQVPKKLSERPKKIVEESKSKTTIETKIKEKNQQVTDANVQRRAELQQREKQVPISKVQESKKAPLIQEASSAEHLQKQSSVSLDSDIQESRSDTDLICLDLSIEQDAKMMEAACQLQAALQEVWSGPMQRPSAARCKFKVVVDKAGKAASVESIESSTSFAYNISVFNALTSCTFPEYLRGVICELVL